MALPSGNADGVMDGIFFHALRLYRLGTVYTE
jgi:hypothetical protein